MDQDSHARIDSCTSSQQWPSGSGTLSIFVVEMGVFCTRIAGLEGCCSQCLVAMMTLL
jgi:hypothetical protein